MSDIQASDCASVSVTFTDHRPPHEVRGEMEQRHKVAYDPVLEDGRLAYHAAFPLNGADCALRLNFDWVEARRNGFTLLMTMSWRNLPSAYHDYYMRSAASWFELWSEGLEVCEPRTRGGEGAGYDEQVAKALEEEARLSDVAWIRQKILTEVKAGASFASAHKEGGTRIGLANGRFYREDFGETVSHEHFEDEVSFLAALRKFYDLEFTRGAASGEVIGEKIWRLILRQLRRS